MDRPTLQVRSDGSEPGRFQLTSSRSIPLNSTQELHETRLELDARVERLSYAIETLREEMASIDQVRPGRVGNESDNDDSDEGREAQVSQVNPRSQPWAGVPACILVLSSPSPTHLFHLVES